jgi:hypothetical protein
MLPAAPGGSATIIQGGRLFTTPLESSRVWWSRFPLQAAEALVRQRGLSLTDHKISCGIAQLNGLNARWFDPVAEFAQFPHHPLRAFSFPFFDDRRTPFLITHLPVQKDPN